MASRCWNWLKDRAAAARRQPALLGVGVALVIGVLAGDAMLVAYLRDRAIAEATRATQNLTYVLAEQTDRSLQSIEIVLGAVAEVFEARRLDSPAAFEAAAAGPDATALLRDKVAGLQHVTMLNLTSARGRPVVSNETSAPPNLDVSDREHIRRAVLAQTDDVIVTAPFKRSSTGEWAVVLARRITGVDGRVVGVVSAILETSRIEELFSRVLLSPRSAINMHRQDGVLLMRYPRAEPMIGSSVAQAPGFAELIEKGKRGAVLMQSPIDGTERIISAFQTPHYPTVIVVATSLADVLSEWRSGKALMIGGGVLASLVIAILIFVLAGAAEYLAEAREALALAGARDLAQRMEREQEAKLLHLARHDALTGLPNRLQFRDDLASRLAALGPGDMLAVHYIDLDRFKSVNDTFGHPIGDELLVQTARRLVSGLRPTETLARLGGDEFAIVQTVTRGPSDAMALARRITDMMQSSFEVVDGVVVVGASIGIALAPLDGDDADDLVRKADLALYAAKAAGRGTFEFFEPSLEVAAKERLNLEQELRTALEREQLEVYYQPLVTLQTGDICGFEALLRWNHPQRGMIGPNDFIPVAEENGLIGRIGEWVLNQACAAAAAWPSSIGVAVNVSAAQFKTSDMTAVVMRALERSGLHPSRLEIEVTESVMLSTSTRAIPALREIQKLGIRIAMDDFGTGFSSLSCLTLFPFDKMKVDKTFVRELGKRDDCHAIVKAATSLASNLRMRTTAEGIETARQLLEVRAVGCTEGQGYLFGRPMPLADVTMMMEEGRLSYRVA